MGEPAEAMAIDGDSCGVLPHRGGWRWWAQAGGTRYAGWAPEKLTAEQLRDHSWASLMWAGARRA